MLNALHCFLDRDSDGIVVDIRSALLASSAGGDRQRRIGQLKRHPNHAVLGGIEPDRRYDGQLIEVDLSPTAAD